MSVEVYSGDLLVEKNTINISNVLGDNLDNAYLQIIAPLDAKINGMFEFKFRIGSSSIPAGYNIGNTI